MSIFYIYTYIYLKSNSLIVASNKSVRYVSQLDIGQLLIPIESILMDFSFIINNTDITISE